MPEIQRLDHDFGVQPHRVEAGIWLHSRDTPTPASKIGIAGGGERCHAHLPSDRMPSSAENQGPHRTLESVCEVALCLRPLRSQTRTTATLLAMLHDHGI